MNDTTEHSIAWQLVLEATDRLLDVVEPIDLDASVCAVLARALEVASGRKLKPIYELYENSATTY